MKPAFPALDSRPRSPNPDAEARQRSPLQGIGCWARSGALRVPAGDVHLIPSLQLNMAKVPNPTLFRSPFLIRPPS